MSLFFRAIETIQCYLCFEVLQQNGVSLQNCLATKRLARYNWLQVFLISTGSAENCFLSNKAAERAYFSYLAAIGDTQVSRRSFWILLRCLSMTNMPVEEVRLFFEVIIPVLVLQRWRWLVYFRGAGCCEADNKQFLVLFGGCWDCM